jgi:hypothetical protein
MFIQRTLLKTIGATGDDSLNACRFQMLQDRVCIVSLVGALSGCWAAHVRWRDEEI